ncbi:MAG: tripartite tricarboxylate transporter substrate-binding protein [Rubrivivax sp.]
MNYKNPKSSALWARWLAVLLAGVLVGITPAKAQQDYPSRTVRVVNTFPPAGPSDIISRAVAEKMQSALKQSFVVENKPGAGGNIGADAVAKAAPDGYTILTGIDTTFTINPNLYKSMPFKPEELKPLMIMASSGCWSAPTRRSARRRWSSSCASARPTACCSARAAMAAPAIWRRRSWARAPG